MKTSRLAYKIHHLSTLLYIELYLFICKVLTTDAQSFLLKNKIFVYHFYANVISSGSEYFFLIFQINLPQNGTVHTDTVQCK